MMTSAGKCGFGWSLDFLQLEALATVEFFWISPNFGMRRLESEQSRGCEYTA